MRRIAMIAFLFCTGCAEYRQDCLWNDCFVGDLCRCLPHRQTDNTAAPVTGNEVAGPALPALMPVPGTYGTSPAPMNKLP